MATNNPFVENDTQVLHEFIARFPLANLTFSNADSLDASALPLLPVVANGKLFLQGHVAAHNPIASLAPAATVLAIFSGANHYISPSWYPEKSREPRVVPTWNYQQVKAQGLLRLHYETAWKQRHITQLTQQHEAAFENPWRVSDAPDDFVAAMLQGIVGIEIEVTKLVGVFKLSQNKSPETRQAVIAALETLGSPLAAAMQA